MHVSMIKMSEEAFSDYLEIAIPTYAQVGVDSGQWSESESLEQSRKAHDAYFPKGIATKNNYLFNLVENESNSTAGHLWMKLDKSSNKPTAFIYDIEVYEPFRRKGYAKYALDYIEDVAANLGAISMSLRVFSHNATALNLYNSIGYQSVSHNMQKPISARGT